MAKPNWVSISPTSVNNDGSFDVTAEDNYLNPAREGIITVAGGGINKTIDVNQKSNRLTLQRVRQAGQSYPPAKIETHDGKVYDITSSSQHSAEINVDIGPTLMMVYPGIGTGSTNFIFQFNIDIDEIALGMSDMSDKSPYINGRINASDPTQVMLTLGNGYPEISNAKLIITVKANDQTMNIYYTNKVDA